MFSWQYLPEQAPCKRLRNTGFRMCSFIRILLSRKRVGGWGHRFCLDPRLNARTHPRFYFTPDFTHNTRFYSPDIYDNNI